jgi:hypothetical protein
MKLKPNNENNGKLKEHCSKTRTILSAIRYMPVKKTTN